MNSNRPNLFNYATKELSQDAMICWLIAWAAQNNGGSSEDEKLRCCGLRFVRALLNHRRDEEDLIKLDRVDRAEIYRQEQGIDVLARINDRHVLLVEDKTDSNDHGDQLARYYRKVVEGRTILGEVDENDLRPIYFKTGNQSLVVERRIERETRYKVFTRKHVLKVLDRCEGRNAILLDYRQYLQGLEDQTNSYEAWTRKDNKESWLAWQGFYRRLESELIINSGRWAWWGYVPNQAGGFLGFAWAAEDGDQLYLQIEARFQPEMPTDVRLCFKVDANGIPKAARQALRDDWSRRVLKAGGDRVVRPVRMGLGERMTVAYWQPDWMAFGEGGRLDMSETIKNLKQVEEVARVAKLSS